MVPHCMHSALPTALTGPPACKANGRAVGSNLTSIARSIAETTAPEVVPADDHYAISEAAFMTAFVSGHTHVGLSCCDALRVVQVLRLKLTIGELTCEPGGMLQEFARILRHLRVRRSN